MKTEQTVDETIREAKRTVFWKLYSLPWIIAIVILLFIVFIQYQSNKVELGTYIEKQEQVRKTGIIDGKRSIEIEAVEKGHGEWQVNRDGSTLFNWKNLARNVGNDYIAFKPAIEDIPLSSPIISNVINYTYLTITNEAYRTNDVYRTNEIVIVNTNIIDKTNMVVEIYVKTNEVIYTRNVIKTNEVDGRSIVELLSEHARNGFNKDDYELSRKLGMDLEGDLIAMIAGKISNETDKMGSNWTSEERDRFINKMVKEVGESVHRTFNGFKTYNRLK
jgi:hypothetical protein